MKNIHNTLIFVAKFAILGLALAFVLGTLAPSWTDRIRGLFSEAPAERRTAACDGGDSDVGNLQHGCCCRAESEFSDRGRRGRTAARAVCRFLTRTRSRARHPASSASSPTRSLAGRRVLVPSDPFMRRVFGVIDAGSRHSAANAAWAPASSCAPMAMCSPTTHVIEGAEDIEAMLSDGRVAKATRVGVDAETDLAVLKLDIGNLVNMTMAQNPLRVGDVVLAIGNPFGHGNTVTMGIVSGLGRQLNLSTYEDFIQTDAAINEGNSGGALINAYGDLVGINTAFKRDQGAEGVGFAIPAATAKTVLDQIIAQGKVIRGWIGAEYIGICLRRERQGRDMASWSWASTTRVPRRKPGCAPAMSCCNSMANQSPISSNCATAKAGLAPGTKVQLGRHARGGEPFTLDMKLEERPQLGQPAS